MAGVPEGVKVLRLVETFHMQILPVRWFSEYFPSSIVHFLTYPVCRDTQMSYHIPTLFYIPYIPIPFVVTLIKIFLT